MAFARPRDCAPPGALLASRNRTVVARLLVAALVASLPFAVADASVRTIQNKKSPAAASHTRAVAHNSAHKNRSSHVSEGGKPHHKPQQQVHQKQPNLPISTTTHNAGGVIIHTPPLTVPVISGPAPLPPPAALSQGPSPPRPPSSLARGPRNSGVPPAGETRYVA